jgi:huntingtin-interacting protein 1-related protein
MISEQARMLKEYEEKQAALLAAQLAEDRARQEREAARQREFEEAQRQQVERERLAQERLLQEQMNQYNNQVVGRTQELERELLGMRGQFERDQLLLEQYDRVSPLGFLSGRLCSYTLLSESKSPRRRVGCRSRKRWVADSDKR